MSAPSWSESISSSLSLDSTLQELTLHEFQIESHQTGREVAQVFEENPLLPGVILTEAGQFIGMISRRRFLEHLSRPFGLDLFLKRPIKLLHGFASANVPIVPGNTVIVTAAREALKRPPEVLYEPIVVELEPQNYRLLDVHQLFIAQSQIHELTTQMLNEQTKAQMIQTEKMASLGQMVAGVAHEILNPVNFIWGNVGYLANYSKDLIELLSIYEAELPDSSKVREFKEEIEFDFLLEDLPQIIDSVKLGSERLKKIVTGLRSFSHMDEANRRPADLHECIDNTLLILNNRIKVGIEIVKHYGELPLINCYSGQLSQVFMNLITNAIDALLDKRVEQENIESLQRVGANAPDSLPWVPTIEVKTEIRSSPPGGSGDCVIIRIADNGSGIPLDIQARIFETFFTTKPVGKGTGLGLAISRQIIVEKHQGQLNLKSELGVGTEFEILLPLL